METDRNSIEKIEVPINNEEKKLTKSLSRKLSRNSSKNSKSEDLEISSYSYDKSSEQSNVMIKGKKNYLKRITRNNEKMQKEQNKKKRFDVFSKFIIYVFSNIVNIISIFNYIFQTYFDPKTDIQSINVSSGLTILEVVTSMYFVFEYILICVRLNTPLWKHIFSIDSLIDVITTLPAIINYFFLQGLKIKLSFIRIFRIFRVFRVLRIYKSIRMMQTEENENLAKEDDNSSEESSNPITLQIITGIVILLCNFFIFAGLVLGLQDMVDDAFSKKQMNFFDAFYFIIVTCSTLGYGDITPTHVISRYFIIFMIVSLFITISNQVSKIVFLMDKWGKGLFQFTNQNHIIVICDGSINLIAFITEIKKKDIFVEMIIISNEFTKLPSQEYPFNKVHLVSVPVIDYEILDRVNTKEAQCIFIFSNKTVIDCNHKEKVIDFLILKINQYFRNVPIYIQNLYSEKTVSNQAKKKLNKSFLNRMNSFGGELKGSSSLILKYKKIVPILRLKSLIISKSMVNPGFATFSQNLLFNDTPTPQNIEEHNQLMQSYFKGCENKICVAPIPNFFYMKDFSEVLLIIYSRSIKDFFTKVITNNKNLIRPVLLVGIIERKKNRDSNNNNIKLFPKSYLIKPSSLGIFICYDKENYLANFLENFQEKSDVKNVIDDATSENILYLNDLKRRRSAMFLEVDDNLQRIRNKISSGTYEAENKLSSNMKKSRTQNSHLKNKQRKNQPILNKKDNNLDDSKIKLEIKRLQKIIKKEMTLTEQFSELVPAVSEEENENEINSHLIESLSSNSGISISRDKSSNKSKSNSDPSSNNSESQNSNSISNSSYNSKSNVYCESISNSKLNIASNKNKETEDKEISSSKSSSKENSKSFSKNKEKEVNIISELNQLLSIDKKQIKNTNPKTDETEHIPTNVLTSTDEFLSLNRDHKKQESHQSFANNNQSIKKRKLRSKLHDEQGYDDPNGDFIDREAYEKSKREAFLKKKNMIQGGDFDTQTKNNILLLQALEDKNVELLRKKLENETVKRYGIIEVNEEEFSDLNYIEHRVFDVEKFSISDTISNHILILGYQDNLSKLLRLISFHHHEKDVCIMVSHDFDEKIIYKLLMQFKFLMLLKGDVQNPVHLINAGVHKSFYVLFLIDQIFMKTNEDMKKILAFKSIDYFFNSEMILELWDTKSTRFIGYQPIDDNCKVVNNEFYHSQFLAGRLIYMSHLERAIAISYTKEYVLEAWIELLSAGFKSNSSSTGFQTLNKDLNNSSFPVIVSIDVPESYEGKDYYVLMSDLLSMEQPVMPLGLYVENPLIYMNDRSQGIVTGNNNDIKYQHTMKIVTSYKKKMVNMSSLGRVEQGYMDNLKILRDVSYNDKVVLDYVDIKKPHLPVFITNPPPDFIIDGHCKVTVMYCYTPKNTHLKNFQLFLNKNNQKRLSRNIWSKNILEKKDLLMRQDTMNYYVNNLKEMLRVNFIEAFKNIERTKEE